MGAILDGEIALFNARFRPGKIGGASPEAPAQAQRRIEPRPKADGSNSEFNINGEIPSRIRGRADDEEFLTDSAEIRGRLFAVSRIRASVKRGCDPLEATSRGEARASRAR